MNNRSESGEAEGPLNHHEELEQWANEAPNPRGRKLTFSEKCGIAWALHKKIKPQVIREAFGLSQPTVSFLRHALTAGTRHYRDVYEEFVRLGPEAFQKTHYPFELHFRLKRVRLGLTHLDETKTDIAPRFAHDPHATKFVGWHTLPDNSRWLIDKPFPNKGYLFHQENQETWTGQDMGGAEEPRPFRTSADAFDGLYEFNGWPNPRKP